MTRAIEIDARRRGISRLCHFTPSRNLSHILDAGAILPTQSLKEDIRAVFNPTDLQRLDGFEDHVCCSVQYPNGWYFSQKRRDEQVFLDWVVLLIDPALLWSKGTKFCRRNAAAQGGQLVEAGHSGYAQIFADSVVGARGRTYTRGPNHMNNCPTDNQAEVLVRGGIPWERVHGMAFRDGTQAQRELARLSLLGYSVGACSLIVAPDMYNKHILSAAISRGQPIEETQWNTTA